MRYYKVTGPDNFFTQVRAGSPEAARWLAVDVFLIQHSYLPLSKTTIGSSLKVEVLERLLPGRTPVRPSSVREIASKIVEEALKKERSKIECK